MERIEERLLRSEWTKYCKKEKEEIMVAFFWDTPL